MAEPDPNDFLAVAERIAAQAAPATAARIRAWAARVARADSPDAFGAPTPNALMAALVCAALAATSPPAPPKLSGASARFIIHTRTHEAAGMSADDFDRLVKSLRTKMEA